MLLLVFSILWGIISVNSQFASPASYSSSSTDQEGGDLTSYLINNVFDAQSFDNLFSQILFGQIADNNFTISGEDRADFNGVGEDYDYGDDRSGRIRRSADMCGILPEGEHCEIVSENGREKRQYKYKENYQKPQYSRPQYKRPAYKDDLRQESEVSWIFDE